MRTPGLFVAMAVLATVACDRIVPGRPAATPVDAVMAPVGTSGEADSRIQAVLDQILDDDAVLRERDINFDVRNGSVTVIGEVRSAAEKDRVTEIVRRSPGVKQVANILVVHAED